MLWERGNRFQPPKPAAGDSILTYASFSEYLRQQFKQSRNLFQHNTGHKKNKNSTKYEKEYAGRPVTPPTQQNSISKYC